MAAEHQEFTDVQFSASSLWNRRGWILAGVVLGAILALGFVLTQPQTNRSWSQVLIRPLGVDLTRGAVNIDRAIDTVAERELAESFIVAERTSQRIGNDISARTLRSEVSVEGVGDSPVLEFSYADGDAETARDIAQAFAESYLEVRDELAEQTVEASRSALEERQADLIGERERLIRELDGLDGEDDRVANASAQAVVSTQIADIANDIALLGALTSDAGTVISPAQLAQRSERPRTVPTVLAGGVLGGLLGLLGALFLDRSLRDRDLTDADLSELGLAPLSHLPRESRGVDAFSGLQRRIAEVMGDEHVVAFTTVDDGSAAGQVAPWFAWNLAEQGARVLLVSADFEQRAIAGQFGLPAGPGLLDALVGGSDPDDVVQRVGGLHVVTAGDHPSDPTSVLQMVGMTRFLNRARRVYDVVVIHAPDITASDSSLLALWAADSATIVVDGEPRGDLQHAHELMSRTDARMLGSIVLTQLNR